MHKLDNTIELELTEAKKKVLKRAVTKDGYLDYKNEFFDIKSENDRVDQFISEVENKYQELYGDDKMPFVKFVEGFITLMNEYPALIRLLLYKIYASEAKFDCDVAKDVLTKLAIFLPNDKSECCINKQSTSKYKYEICTIQKGIQRTYRGDIMNSFWSLFKSFLQNCLHEELHLNAKSVPKEKRLFGESPTTWIHHFIICYSEIPDNKKNTLIQFNEFAEVNHTLGNFFLVPYVHELKLNNFNNKRSRSFKDNFYFTLKDIKNACDHRPSTLITSDMMYWLESYNNNFHDLLIANKLEDFYPENTPTHNACPCFSSTYIPKTLDDINSYLTYIIQKIKKRNEELKNALEEIENTN